MSEQRDFLAKEFEVLVFRVLGAGDYLIAGAKVTEGWAERDVNIK